ncbi:MAG: STM3941 family protein [Caulobacter sp.]|nr:STM3941 family protein [Caulobacter sp.]
MILLTLGSAAFVAAGAFMLSRPEAFGIRGQIAGVLAVTVFGLFGLIGLWRIFDRKLVLRIDAQGVFDRRIADEPSHGPRSAT